MSQEVITYCRICEPFCGMVATVENRKLVSLRPDKEHPLSQGFACPKGIAYTQVQNDPDRVLYPLKRQPDGRFTRVSWDEAMADITERLRRIHRKHGGDGIAVYGGNPAALNYSHALWMNVFLKALGIRHFFGPGTQDTNSRFVASHLLYGSLFTVPVPDIEAAELVVILGANPAVSHGSLVNMPRMMDKLHAVTERGGRVLVIDPRRTETAREFEWQPIVPDADAWLLLSLLHVLFAEGLADQRALATQATGARALRELTAAFPPEDTAALTCIPAGVVRDLARQLSQKRAVVYSRLGTCLGSSPTLANFLLDAVNLVSGNLDRPGGWVFGNPPIPLQKIVAPLMSYGKWHSRIGGFPEVIGMEPAANMAAEITTPGKGQVRALIVSAGNPVLSTPGGHKLAEVLDQLELMVSIDLYQNETNAHADYILPGVAMYEREDFPIFSMGLYVQPFMQATPAVVPPAGEARHEWMVYEELARSVLPETLRNAVSQVRVKGLGPTPRLMLDSLIRLGYAGDRWGLRRDGLNLDTLLQRHPHGLKLAERPTTGQLHNVVRHRDCKVHLDHPEIREEVRRLQARRPDPDYPLYLIGLRELRSENSWMHNPPALRAARPPHAARIHPDDAAALGLLNRGRVRLVSPWGAIELPVLVTDEVSRGVVAVPHGWGHKGQGGWANANRDGGVSVNDLMGTRPSALDPLSGMSHLFGVRIRAERVPAEPESPAVVALETGA